MRISDWSSDVCSSDLQPPRQAKVIEQGHDTDKRRGVEIAVTNGNDLQCACDRKGDQRHANPVQQLVGRIAVAGTVFIQPLCEVSHRRLLAGRSEEHTSELQSLMRISYAVFCLTKKTQDIKTTLITTRK